MTQKEAPNARPKWGKGLVSIWTKIPTMENLGEGSNFLCTCHFQIMRTACTPHEYPGHGLYKSVTSRRTTGNTNNNDQGEEGPAGYRWNPWGREYIFLNLSSLTLRLFPPPSLSYFFLSTSHFLLNNVDFGTCLVCTLIWAE